MLIPGEFIETLGIGDIDKNVLDRIYESGSSISTAYMSAVVALLIQDLEDFCVNELLDYIRVYEYDNDFIDINDFVRGYQ